MLRAPLCSRCWFALHHSLWVLFALVLGMLWAAPSTAMAQRVRAHTSTDSVQIGERFVISLTATHRFNTSAVFPEATAGPDIFGDVEVLDRSAVTERYVGHDAPGMRVDSVVYTVTTFALDTARVPALPVQIVTGADTLPLASRPMQIAVRSTVPLDAQGVRGLAPLATFPGPRWPWVLLALVAVILVVGLVYWWRQRGVDNVRPVAPHRLAPEPSPYDAAVQRLRTLEKQTDWTAPDALEAFFVDLSMTLRRYMAARFDVAALERTTGELIRDLRAHSIPPTPAVDRLDDVLTEADLVKFADERPSGREGRAALETARSALDAIEHAVPAPPEPAPPPEPASAPEPTTS